MTADADRLFVVTGGPGSGKSSLIDRLASLRFATAPEAGRAIIRDQLAIGGPALPWADTGLFAELILSWELRSYRQAIATPGPVFLDRGVPDVLGYLYLLGADVPAHVRKAVDAFPYHRRVFIAPHWPEIYTHDEERKQSLGESERTHDAMARAYTECGYDLVPLPLTTIEERAEFVLTTLGLAG